MVQIILKVSLHSPRKLKTDVSLVVLGNNLSYLSRQHVNLIYLGKTTVSREMNQSFMTSNFVNLHG